MSLIDSTYKEIPAKGHTAGAMVIENETESSCTVAGTYDEVIYCTVCGKELSRETKTKALANCVADEPVTETENGIEYEVTYCKDCGSLMSKNVVGVETYSCDIRFYININGSLSIINQITVDSGTILQPSDIPSSYGYSDMVNVHFNTDDLIDVVKTHLYSINNTTIWKIDGSDEEIDLSSTPISSSMDLYTDNHTLAVTTPNYTYPSYPERVSASNHLLRCSTYIPDDTSTPGDLGTISYSVRAYYGVHTWSDGNNSINVTEYFNYDDIVEVFGNAPDLYLTGSPEYRDIEYKVSGKTYWTSTINLGTIVTIPDRTSIKDIWRRHGTNGRAVIFGFNRYEPGYTVELTDLWYELEELPPESLLVDVLYHNSWVSGAMKVCVVKNGTKELVDALHAYRFNGSSWIELK